MQEKFKDLHEALKQASGDTYPTIPDFAFRAPREEFVLIERLDNLASKFDRLLVSFLEYNSDILKDFDEQAVAETSAAESAYEDQKRTAKFLSNLDDTVKELEADILATPADDVEDFRQLQYLRQVFDAYKPALQSDYEQEKENFKAVLSREVGRRIRQVRKYHGLSQEEFASRILTPRINIARYELGILLPPVTTLYQIAETFNVGFEFLLGRENVTDGRDRNADNQK